MNYTDSNRGTIQFRDRANQLIVFNGMTFGNISPTDVDGLLEYHDRGYVICECKHTDAEMPRGQEVALTRMIDDFKKAGKEAVLLICEHNSGPNEDIQLKETIVREVYYNGKFHKLMEKLTAYEYAKRIFRYIDEKEKA